MSFTISEVVSDAQALCNDVAGATYTTARVTPLVKFGHRELRDRMNRAGYSVTLEKVVPAVVTAGSSTYPGSLPNGLAFPHKMEERAQGGTDKDWIPMFPAIVEPARDSMTILRDWIFRSFQIYFVPALQNREVRLWYWGRFLPVVVDGSTVVSQEMMQNYLSYRTAAIAARVIGEDTERAADLQGFASEEMEVIMGQLAGGEQNLRIVRPPRMRRF